MDRPNKASITIALLLCLLSGFSILLPIHGCQDECDCGQDRFETEEDEETTTIDETSDSDNDGWTPADGDCNDEDENINPDADDLCNDSIDNDCDGIVDKYCSILIPEGEFNMGSLDDIGYDDSEHPLHAVYLYSYYIDKYEVTNAEYRECVDDGVCEEPITLDSYTRDSYFYEEEYRDYPVVKITRAMAREFCEWRGGRLPTEAEWEKAAKGDEDLRLFPWGDWINCNMANFAWCYGDTVRIGSFPDNISPYGVADMAGNVWEMVNDYYDSDYYSTSPYENPQGPEEGEFMTLRGGAFTWSGPPTTTVRHPGIHITSNFYNIGFRCVYDAE